MLSINQVEVERKWLMDGYPDLPMDKEVLQWQAYLCFEPVTVRIRRITGEGWAHYLLTIKGKGTISRTEVELPLEAEQFEALAALAVAPSATKRLRYYKLPGGHTLECSLVDEDEKTAFYYAEVEFESEQQAAEFEPLAFFGQEVTHQPGYTMAAYCRKKAGLAAE